MGREAVEVLERVGRGVAAGLPATRLVRAVGSDERHHVTSLELYFDLAYVFAFTQVSRLMAHHHDADGIVQGVAVLALLWWSWTAFGWLANLAHADEGVTAVATVVAMGGVFVAGLAVPEAFEDAAGGLHGPLVFVAAYLVARVAHAVVCVAAAGDEPASRRRAAATVVWPQVPSTALLVTGALAGSPWQLWCVLAAVAVEPAASWLLARGAEWRVHSAEHFAERYRLIVILALGESVVAIGVGVAGEPVSGSILVGVVLAFLVSVAMWWAYFPRVAASAERVLAGLRGPQRARVALDGYTYLHLLLVVGIVLAALGVEVALAHIASPEGLGAFGASALGGGVACYFVGTAFVARRVVGEWLVLRLVGAAASVVATVVLAGVAPAAALAGVAGLLVGLLVIERLARRVGAPSGAGLLATS
jgi:low temperature requirement protein LtrA